MNHLTRARSVFEMEIEELRGVLSRLDENFNKAVDLMSRALDRGNKIVIAGVGKSGNVGAKIVATLNSTGTPTVMLDSLNALHGDLGIVQDGDVCIAMSFSGETTELLTLLPFIKRFELPVISMTGNIHSSLAKYSDVVLDTGVSREACPLNLAPTSSTTAMLVMGDALAMARVEARHFTAKDFAKRHPGGSLGRALLTRVSDIMRQGDEMAILPETATVNDCLKAMTTAHTGACILLTADGKLAGIFTHGDFVRAYGANPLIGQQPVGGLMTRNPIYVMEDDLAAEAVKAVSNRHIDDLVVLNKDMAPVGIIDLQDLARMKLV